MLYKIGLYGGAFDPPHKGHINVVKSAAAALQIDKFLIMPSGESPHKDNRTEFKHRLNMCKIAFAQLGEVSALEGEISGKSYTIDTLKKIKQIYPDSSVFLIIGSDMLFGFKGWNDYSGILKLCKIAAVARNHGEHEAVSEAVDTLNAILINAETLPMSSSEIREKIAAGDDVERYITKEVMEYVRQHELY
ncbi:MAG: nicotinate (nicotinamide) nucleotide adenylyltransferase [Oscillospiraceae bacterium]|nr:nicotinate (nicotinamide) nucleotide adenylyltransferase [Oscillospiraceae bacterium]